MSESADAAAAKPEVASKSFVLKVKPDGAVKWQVLGYVSMRTDLSGGVATLIREDGKRLEKVAVFTQDKRKTDGE